MKYEMSYAPEKARRRAIRKRKKHIGYWAKKKAKREWNWKQHYVTKPAGGPWKVWRKQWVSMKKEIRITREEFDDLINSPQVGGLVNVWRVRGVNGIVSLDTLWVVGYNLETLYKGKLVPEGLDPKTGRKYATHPRSAQIAEWRRKNKKKKRRSVRKTDRRYAPL